MEGSSSSLFIALVASGVICGVLAWTAVAPTDANASAHRAMTGEPPDEPCSPHTRLILQHRIAELGDELTLLASAVADQRDVLAKDAALARRREVAETWMGHALTQLDRCRSTR